MPVNIKPHNINIGVKIYDRLTHINIENQKLEQSQQLNGFLLNISICGRLNNGWCVVRYVSINENNATIINK